MSVFGSVRVREESADEGAGKDQGADNSLKDETRYVSRSRRSDRVSFHQHLPAEKAGFFIPS
jgi:hypothetical protein